MALAQFISAIVLAFVTLPSLARATTTHFVGDHYGWALNFDYAAWAKGRHFYVGDKLVFKYPKGYHNVYKVDGYDFNKCKVPQLNGAMDAGYDVITLTTPGRKWYICGKAYGKHCMMGQKLFIYVKPKPYMPPKPPVGRHPIHHFVGDAFGWKFNFDYAAWARGRDFRVGDSLVFKYPRGYHNVYKVSGPEFNYCKVPQATEALTSGYDVIKLTSPGRKWYICGKAHGKHCQMGQKLFIFVKP
ncbi:uncharacterized protein A4U43_C03F4610 [Asparagus officinalis]|uniref:Phytocyanin domain-containing protein n=1 Tax=Asparagus officinalis TaxID=4686 RepID=A0A5P1F7D2_ASPOF|nr:lamin-like protein [Asparagus officinalis]ONK74278.1 uncharacterized protein A4U43_C03F4610 [Asparagus officinalis]